MARKKSKQAAPTEYAGRRQQLLALFRQHRIDSLLVTALPNVRYLSGFTGSNGALLLSESRAILFTDPRYQAQAPLESDCDVKIASGPLLVEVSKWFRRLGIQRLGFERGRISFESYDFLKREAKNVKLIPIAGVIEQIRMV